LSLLKLLPKAQRELVTTEAFEYKYILSGEMEYLINGGTFHLKKDDPLFFDERLSHVPGTLQKPITRLKIHRYLCLNIKPKYLHWKKDLYCYYGLKIIRIKWCENSQIL